MANGNLNYPFSRAIPGMVKNYLDKLPASVTDSEELIHSFTYLTENLMPFFWRVPEWKDNNLGVESDMYHVHYLIKYQVKKECLDPKVIESVIYEFWCQFPDTHANTGEEAVNKLEGWEKWEKWDGKSEEEHKKRSDEWIWDLDEPKRVKVEKEKRMAEAAMKKEAKTKAKAEAKKVED